MNGHCGLECKEKTHVFHIVHLIWCPLSNKNDISLHKFEWHMKQHIFSESTILTTETPTTEAVKGMSWKYKHISFFNHKSLSHQKIIHFTYLNDR